MVSVGLVWHLGVRIYEASDLLGVLGRRVYADIGAVSTERRLLTIISFLHGK